MDRSPVSSFQLKAELAIRLNRARARIVQVERERRRARSDRVFHKPELVTQSGQ